jgi:hypothetical protein
MKEPLIFVGKLCRDGVPGPHKIDAIQRRCYTKKSAVFADNRFSPDSPTARADEHMLALASLYRQGERQLQIGPRSHRTIDVEVHPVRGNIPQMPAEELRPFPLGN